LRIIERKKNMELVVFSGAVIFAERAETDSTKRNVLDDNNLTFPVIG